ncbi:MAG: MG2 domain-containing protein, partial [Pirellulaceae bacterium]
MTLRRVLFPVISGFLVIASLTMVQTMSGVETSPPNRSRVEQLFRDGNWKEAWDGYRALCLDPGTDAAAVARDFINAVQCLRNLGLISEFDALAEGTVAAHAGNWRLLHTVASQYQHIDKNGFIIAGKFERGPHRGGGNHVQALARDRVRSLQLMRQALPLAMADDQKADTAAFLMDFAGMVQQQPYGQSYQLQRLTNLDELPDYDSAMMYGFWGQVSTGAPVAADGQPVFYHVPDSWAAASSDGERWRWLLAQVDEVAPDRRNDVRWHLAEFLWQQFGVQTLQEMRILLARSAGEPTDSGRYALHTLGEQETIARLATGIKRFELPDEFNFIRIYQAIVAEPRTGHSEDALNRLAEIFENRRQYPQAAEHWKRSIALHGPGNDNWKRKRLDQIVGNWGQFEPVSTQPEGQGATVEFRFRNATQVSFEARRIDVAGLLAEVKRYLRSNPARFDWSMIQIQNIGSWILQQPRQPFIGERVATWKQTLSPLPQHFDRRITITTPLREAGAYLVTASLPDGNRSTIVLWVDDMAIVHQTLAGGNHYFVADAVTGAPIPGANVEFFGFRPEAVRNNRPRVVTKNFAELTNRDGQLVPSARDLADDYQWLVIARTKEGRFAHLGFNSVWTADYHDAQYNEVKVYCITDRPVYRPGQKVHYKFWIRHAQYDNDRSNFAGQTFPIELHDPRGEKIQTWSHTSDAYAGLEGEWEIPNDATLGTYQLLVTQHGGGSFRVEEYKKPEFEVTVQAPDEPVKLGEKIEARINAKYYFGAPVTQATVKYKVTRQEHSQQWYPAAPWDWCFGRGYWWYAYDYTWYPGWNRWAGCLRPSPWWWPMPVDPPEVVAEREVAIGADGTLVVEIDTQVAQELHGDSDHRYTITAEVRDESRRIIVGQGDVLVTREPFKVFSWVDRGYYRVGDTVNASFLAQTLDNRPVTGQGVLKLLQIQYPGDKEQPVETEVQRWDLDTNEEGRASQ